LDFLPTKAFNRGIQFSQRANKFAAVTARNVPADTAMQSAQADFVSFHMQFQLPLTNGGKTE